MVHVMLNTLRESQSISIKIQRAIRIPNGRKFRQRCGKIGAASAARFPVGNSEREGGEAGGGEEAERVRVRG